jgi:hypothetical protein
MSIGGCATARWRRGMAKTPAPKAPPGRFSWPSLSGCPQRSPGRKIAFCASNPQVFASAAADVLAVSEGRDRALRSCALPSMTPIEVCPPIRAPFPARTTRWSPLATPHERRRAVVNARDRSRRCPTARVPMHETHEPFTGYPANGSRAPWGALTQSPGENMIG